MDNYETYQSNQWTANKNLRNKRILRLSVSLLILGLIAWIIYWVSGHAFLVATVSNPGNGHFSYRLTDAEGNETVVESASANIRRLVSKGSYQVTVTQGETSYLKRAKVGGFLSTARVESALVAEKGREFVGNNPKPCINYSGGVLISWLCRGNLVDATKHVPATASVPTYVSPLAPLESARLLSVFNLGNSAYALVSVDTKIYFYRLDEKGGRLVQESKVELKLPAGVNYSALAYKDGVLVYSHDGNLYRYQNLTSQPQEISIGSATTEGLELYSVSTDNDQLIITYNQNVAPELPGTSLVTRSGVISEETLEEEDEGKHTGTEVIGKTEVVVIKNDQTMRYLFDIPAHQVRPCGDNKLCLLHSDKLEVYDISSETAARLFMWPGVLQIETIAGGLRLVNRQGIALLDTVSETGFFEYSFGNYSFCGLRSYENHYLVCVADGTERSVLKITPDQENNSSIDKKIMALRERSEVKSASVYGQFIFISPDAGELQYIAERNAYGYNPQQLNEANSAIDAALSEIGLNIDLYKVINPLK